MVARTRPSFLDPLLRTTTCAWTVVNQRGETLATTVECAFDSASRRTGLLGRDRLGDGHAVILAPCRAIHTCFMRFPIDVVHVDRGGRVLRVRAALRPWRADACLRGWAVIELPACGASRVATAPGDVLEVRAAR
jgi:uncharacterized membrane protein (UPF0127 family)